jgi:prepilin-type N-terminal cleavage/methylation domain-containing protein/prepilin-type processing-associated H-X9-DG protein
MRKRHGFTLIELLVVIAIIAILAAILFPVFAKARSKARQAACNSNVKQLALAFMQYTSDYDGKYPSVYDDNDKGNGGYPYDRVIWADKIFPYVKNREVFACPGGPNEVDLTPLAGCWPNNLQGTRYQMNMCHDWAWPEDTVTPYYPIKDSFIRYPASINLIIEGSNCWWNHWLTHNGWNAVTMTSDGLALVGVLGEVAYPRHNEGMNIAYCDGHVKWMKTQQMVSNDLYDPLWTFNAP